MLVLALQFSRGDEANDRCSGGLRRPATLAVTPSKRKRGRWTRARDDGGRTESATTHHLEDGLASAPTGIWLESSPPAEMAERAEQQLLRKEVIQPHLPVRLPCYDFTPITDPTFDGSLLAVGPPASGVADFRGVTGGVYKARERIHRGNADPRLLATPPS